MFIRQLLVDALYHTTMQGAIQVLGFTQETQHAYCSAASACCWWWSTSLCHAACSSINLQTGNMSTAPQISLVLVLNNACLQCAKIPSNNTQICAVVQITLYPMRTGVSRCASATKQNSKQKIPKSYSHVWFACLYNHTAAVQIRVITENLANEL